MPDPVAGAGGLETSGIDYKFRLWLFC